MQHQELVLKAKQADLASKIQNLPAGNLTFSKTGHYIKWYNSKGSKRIYIPKKERKSAEELALKKYFELQLEEVTLQLDDIQKMLQNPIFQSNSSKLLDDSSYYCELLNSYFQAYPNELTQWRNTAYTRNSNYPEHLIHKTLAGHLVRSKSEVIIANALFINKIPYRYECELFLNNICIYPDFTIYHPIKCKEIYWEHYGLMDNKDYQATTFEKQRIYAENGIIPTINLITTYETGQYPLDSTMVQKIIEEFFCN